MNLDDRKKKVCDYLVDSLDEDGYLRESEDLIADKLGVDLDLVEECIGLVQGLEPAGICARNLQECIILQLHSEGIYDDVLEDIIKNNINLVANSNIKQLASKYKKKQEEIAERNAAVEDEDDKEDFVPDVALFETLNIFYDYLELLAPPAVSAEAA